MADFKYIRYCFESLYKLSAYIVCCAAVKGLCMQYMSHPLDKILPGVLMIPVTWFFLEVVEGGRRSFFATGYIVENIVPAGIWGICAGASGYVLALLFRHSSIRGITMDFDFNEPLYTTMDSAFFVGIVLFGYFFHILQSDFGIGTAIAVTSVIYGVINSLGSELFVVEVILHAFPAAAAGVMILHLGDMRSAMSFLCLMKFTGLMAEQLFTHTSSFEFVFAVPVVSAICMVSMLNAYASEKAEAQKRIEEVMEMRKKRKRKNG